MNVFRTFVRAMALMVVLASPAAAQNFRDRALALVGGWFQYDLSGTGTVTFVGVRVDLPKSTRLIIEPGVTYTAYRPQSDNEKISLLIPELQFQLQLATGRVRPFLGVGAGAVLISGGVPAETELMLSGAGGFRFRLNDKWGLRTELRMRAIDPFTGTAAEWTGGASVRF